MNEETNAALPAVPAARTKGSTGRQQVAAARMLPTAEIAAANVPFEWGFAVVLIVSVFMCARIPSSRASRIARSAQSQPQSYDAESLVYHHSSRNALPTPITTNGQTKRLFTSVSVTPDSRNTIPAI